MNIVDIKKRTKLGKEKANKIIATQEDGSYMELYVLASNKYIYIVIFAGNSQEDLNS